MAETEQGVVMRDNTNNRRPPILLDLPDSIDLAAVEAAEVEIIRLAARRLIGAREALTFTWMLDHRRRVIADRELEARMDRLEEQGRMARGEGT
jgi:hypothetical protein